MTEETVRAFAERITTDEEFARRLGSASSPDERLKMANDAGYDLSASDLSAIKTALSVEELSDEDLEKVAGGIGATTTPPPEPPPPPPPPPSPPPSPSQPQQFDRLHQQ